MSENKLRPPDATSAAITKPRITDVTYQRRAEALEAERDQLRQQVELLLERADAHRAERAHGRTANLDWADKQLDQATDQVRKELEG